MTKPTKADSTDEIQLAHAMRTAPAGAVSVGVQRMANGAGARGETCFTVPADPDIVANLAEEIVAQGFGPGAYVLQERLANGQVGRVASIRIAARAVDHARPPAWSPPPPRGPYGAPYGQQWAQPPPSSSLADMVAVMELAKKKDPMDRMLEMMQLDMFKSMAGRAQSDPLETFKAAAEFVRTGQMPRSELAEVASVFSDTIASIAIGRRAKEPKELTDGGAAKKKSSPDRVKLILRMCKRTLELVELEKMTLEVALEELAENIGEPLVDWLQRNAGAVRAALEEDTELALLAERTGALEAMGLT